MPVACSSRWCRPCLRKTGMECRLIPQSFDETARRSGSSRRSSRSLPCSNGSGLGQSFFDTTHEKVVNFPSRLGSGPPAMMWTTNPVSAVMFFAISSNIDGSRFIALEDFRQIPFKRRDEGTDICLLRMSATDPGSWVVPPRWTGQSPSLAFSCSSSDSSCPS